MALEKIDIETLSRKGITEEKLSEELTMLREGFPYLRIEGPAVVGNGISRMSEEMQSRSIDIWDQYLAAGGRVLKMVPASGAASRMFKDVFAFVNGKKDKPDSDFMKRFFDNIEDFAFFADLNNACMCLYDLSVSSLIKEGRFKDVAKALLNAEGLDYGQLPKALLKFHKVPGTSRTALEEHLAEGAQYASGKDGMVRIHFTVSENHVPLVYRKIEEEIGVLGKRYGVRYEVDMSTQKPSTDTVAANLDGTPYRENGELFFRPGGHGALIENLNDLDADIIFIKNIDNVVPDKLREATLKYKKVIAGYLIELHDKVAAYVRLIDNREYTEAQLQEICYFLRDKFSFDAPELNSLKGEDLSTYLRTKLNRPMRVCGMVKNEGEPGGGPYIAYNSDGSRSLQILESTQIDLSKDENKQMMAKATHFNPVDLVCYITDVTGKPFDLTRYVDPQTGFISSKSLHGRSLRALELPGLWNGAMSDWLTAFVEVPIATFNPVKTVNDLLRPQHQG